MNLSTSTASQKDIIKFAPTATDGLDDFVEVVSELELLDGDKELIATISEKELEKNSDGKYEVAIKDILNKIR